MSAGGKDDVKLKVELPNGPTWDSFEMCKDNWVGEGTSPGSMVHEVEKLPALPEPTQEVKTLLNTVLVNGFETVTLQTDFSNPGVWMAHCHILEHAELGMMTEIHVGQ